MKVRDRIIDLITSGNIMAFGRPESFVEIIADNLIANGVTIQRVGRWVLEREPNGKPYCFHCSVCDDDFHHIGIMVAYDYCPNCGAKMDSSVNE